MIIRGKEADIIIKTWESMRVYIHNPRNTQRDGLECSSCPLYIKGSPCAFKQLDKVIHGQILVQEEKGSNWGEGKG